MSIDDLLFATEGYEQAKNILKSKFGKESKTLNTYVSNIMSLPVISNSSLQALETMGKLREVNGYIRMMLNNLEGIRGD